MLLKELPPATIEALLYDWLLYARSGQYPSLKDGWLCWLVLGGRGSGKTRTGAEWVRARACGLWPETGKSAQNIALVAPNFREARHVMIEGQSGLLAIHSEATRPLYEPSKRQLTWPNGAIAHIFSAEEPEGLRGPQFDAAWCDELAKWKQMDAVWDMLQFGLRIGDKPRVVVTTTPRPVTLLKNLMALKTTEISHSRTKDNAAFLAESFLQEINLRYGGTVLGRQELDGELIEDDPQALFRRDIIERNRISHAPSLGRIIVAVDPPISIGTQASECGIVCAGIGLDGRAYVLADRSVQGLRPAQWAKQVIGLYHEFKASRVVAEINQGGAMVEAVLREVDRNVAFSPVHATRGKAARAEPVAALYEQARVSHVGIFPQLEDQMCQVIMESKNSPDRLDALVWAISHLMLHKQNNVPRVRFI